MWFVSVGDKFSEICYFVSVSKQFTKFIFRLITPFIITASILIGNDGKHCPSLKLVLNESDSSKCESFPFFLASCCHFNIYVGEKPRPNNGIINVNDYVPDFVILSQLIARYYT